MANGQFHTVRFLNNNPADIEMREDQGYEEETHNGFVAPDVGWQVIFANPARYLAWVRRAAFANVNPDGSFGPGFRPDSSKLAKLDSLRQGVRGWLGITLVSEKSANTYSFIDGRHRAYWLAINNAVSVPLLVPAHQVAHFKDFL
ncbi:hypothetical protein [Bordetella ansorpii]|uniref:hypothetical protein n=1 Tax=Bordetella ansorpii TaxID=288768 RepID=UPI000A92D14F|nr:hypothetical protein [Bordetella ansorpii]